MSATAIIPARNGESSIAATVRTAPAQAVNTIAALIAAHNEEGTIAAVIEALLEQTCVPDRIVVIADNCTDGTEVIARRYPVTVIRTEGNLERKPGALN